LPAHVRTHSLGDKCGSASMGPRLRPNTHSNNINAILMDPLRRPHDDSDVLRLSLPCLFLLKSNPKKMH
jgi:hypothetical protein